MGVRRLSGAGRYLPPPPPPPPPACRIAGDLVNEIGREALRFPGINGLDDEDVDEEVRLAISLTAASAKLTSKGFILVDGAEEERRRRCGDDGGEACCCC